MLIQVENVNGATAGFDVFEIVSITPASAKGDGGVPLLGTSLLGLRGMPFGTGVLIREPADAAVARVNALRLEVIRAQAMAAQGRPIPLAQPEP